VKEALFAIAREIGRAAKGHDSGLREKDAPRRP